MMNKDDRCAPSKKYKDGTCFTYENLQDIGNEMNKKYSSINIDTSLPKKKLLKQLVVAIKDKYDCDDQLCWVNLDIMPNDEIKNNTFRPSGPDVGTKWLSTTDIDQVLKQYESVYPDFVSFGAVPRDFKSLPYLEMNSPKYNFKNLITKNKSKIGMVVNFDYSTGKGTHWVSVFADLKNGKIYYSDSYGTKPINEIEKFMDKTENFIRNKYNIDVDRRHNKTVHQKKNSECGVYSINFILRLLKGETFDDLTSNRLPDDTVNKCRQKYFT